MLSAPLVVGNRQYIPEPQAEEQHMIYASQVLIPVSVSDKTHALSGPLAETLGPLLPKTLRLGILRFEVYE